MTEKQHQTLDTLVKDYQRYEKAAHYAKSWIPSAKDVQDFSIYYETVSPSQSFDIRHLQLTPAQKREVCDSLEIVFSTINKCVNENLEKMQSLSPLEIAMLLQK